MMDWIIANADWLVPIAVSVASGGWAGLGILAKKMPVVWDDRIATLLEVVVKPLIVGWIEKKLPKKS